jgi:hypothetical protein
MPRAYARTCRCHDTRARVRARVIRRPHRYVKSVELLPANCQESSPAHHLIPVELRYVKSVELFPAISQNRGRRRARHA